MELSHEIAGEGSPVLEIPGTAHVPSIERPEEFDRLVLAFLGTQ